MAAKTGDLRACRNPWDIYSLFRWNSLALTVRDGFGLGAYSELPSLVDS